MQKSTIMFIRIVFLAAVFLFFAPCSEAQRSKTVEQDVLYLKNGSVLRGRFIDSATDSVVRIEIAGGSIFAHRTEEIERIVHNERAVVEDFERYTRHSKGVEKEDLKAMRGTWFHHSGMKASVGWSSYSLTGTIGIMHSSGYYIRHWLGIGAGASIERNTGYTLAPMYLSLRGILTPSYNALFYGFDIGYNLPFRSSGQGSEWTSRETLSAKGGIYLHPSIGLRFYSRSRAHFTLDIGYVFQTASYTYRDMWWDGSFGEPYTESRRWARPTLRLGMMF